MNIRNGYWKKGTVASRNCSERERGGERERGSFS